MQQPPDRRRRHRHAFPGELVADPLRTARRPRQRDSDHPALGLDSQGRRAVRTDNWSSCPNRWRCRPTLNAIGPWRIGLSNGGKVDRPR